MGISQTFTGFVTRAVPPATSEPKPAASTASAAFSRLRPAWTREVMENLGSKKAPPPVPLAGATWMKQHAGQQRVKLHSGMTAGTLLAATRQIFNMSDDHLKLLAEDIHAVLTTYSDGNKNLQKAANRYFRSTYAKLFEKESYSFENEAQRNLMTCLRDLIRSQTVARGRPVSVTAVAAATSVAPVVPVVPVVPVAPIAPIDFPGFNPIATNQAFEIIRNAYLERVEIERNNLAVPMPTPTPASPETSRGNRMTRILRAFRNSGTPLRRIQPKMRRRHPELAFTAARTSPSRCDRRSAPPRRAAGRRACAGRTRRGFPPRPSAA